MSEISNKRNPRWCQNLNIMFMLVLLWLLVPMIIMGVMSNNFVCQDFNQITDDNSKAEDPEISEHWVFASFNICYQVRKGVEKYISE